jgi:putative endonuclease
MYTGVTNNLERRLYEHKNDLVDGFTKNYHVHKLVYLECTDDVYSAIEREKQIKGWIRAKKNGLVEQMNPDWRDLSDEWREDSSLQDATQSLRSLQDGSQSE